METPLPCPKHGTHDCGCYVRATPNCPRCAQLEAALIWCSGAPQFDEGGEARDGWLKVCAPLLHAQSDTPAPSVTVADEDRLAHTIGEPVGAWVVEEFQPTDDMVTRALEAEDEHRNASPGDRVRAMLKAALG